MQSLRFDILASQSLPPLRGELLWVYRGKPRFEADRQDNEFETAASIFFVEEGLVSLRWKGGSAVCKPKDLFLSRLGLRRQTIAPGTRLLSVGYDLAWSSELPVFDAGLNLHIPAVAAGRGGCGKLRQASLELFRKIHREPGRGDFHEATRDEPDPTDLQAHVDRHAAFWKWIGVLAETFSALGIPASVPLAKNPVVRRVKSRLDECPLDRPFRPAALLTDIDVGWRRVQQLFQAEMHISPNDYFEKRRLYHARIRLKQPKISVKVVAAELGFRSLSHFSIWFKRHFGRSPRLFQNHL